MRRPTPVQDLAGSCAGSACAGFSSAFWMSFADGAAMAGFTSVETDSGFMLGVFVICRGAPFKGSGQSVAASMYMVLAVHIYNRGLRLRQR